MIGGGKRGPGGDDEKEEEREQPPPPPVAFLFFAFLSLFLSVASVFRYREATEEHVCYASRDLDRYETRSRRRGLRER